MRLDPASVVAASHLRRALRHRLFAAKAISQLQSVNPVAVRDGGHCAFLWQPQTLESIVGPPGFEEEAEAQTAWQILVGFQLLRQGKSGTYCWHGAEFSKADALQQHRGST